MLGWAYPWVEDDADQAIIEFGEWVEGEIRRECERVAEGLDKDLTTAQRRARIEAVAEEVWFRLVKREIRKKRQTMPGYVYVKDENGEIVAREWRDPQVFYMVKPFSGDPAKDFDMSDAKIVWVND